MRKHRFFAVLAAFFAATLAWAQPVVIPSGLSAGGAGSPGGSSGQIQYNNGGSFGGASGLTTDGVGSLTAAISANSAAYTETGYSLTGSNAQSLFNLAGTLNTTGSPDVIKLAITDTARGANTKFLNIYGGASGTTSEFAIANDGSVTQNNPSFAASNDFLFTRSAVASLRAGSARVSVLSEFGLGANASSPDVFFDRDAANVLGLRNGATAQTLRLYNTFTDASNYERASLLWSSNVAYLKPENAGTGSARLMIVVSGSTTVSGLPAASTAGAGARAFVTDATSCSFNSTVTGSGSTKCPVVSDGTNWLAG